MRFKIGESPDGSLCRSCENGRIIQRANGHEQAYCHIGHMLGQTVPLDIVKCTEYEDKRRVSRYELEKIAWTVRHNQSGLAIGFEPPKKKADE